MVLFDLVQSPANDNNFNASNANVNKVNANDANANNTPSLFVGGARARTMLLAALIIIIIIRAYDCLTPKDGDRHVHAHTHTYTYTRHARPGSGGFQTKQRPSVAIIVLQTFWLHMNSSAPAMRRSHSQ